jgi:putative FmdB family regulatory protein
MPRYDFQCIECVETFEVTRPAGQAKDEVCPTCGGATRRVFSPVGVVFKGSGFHNTDYKTKPSESPAKSDAAPACGSADSGSSKCASCPASGGS